MKRRTLDLMFSLGGVAIAILLTVAGVVLTANANFATNYVSSQLAEQNITFKTLDTLTPEERTQPGLVEYAGQKLTTGKQAEVYALQFIGLHLKNTAGGQTYADLGVPQSRLRAQVAEATKNNDPNLTALQQQLTDVTAQRETMFKGETLRGLLLTTYGFSEFGVKAGQAALVAYLAALVMALLSIAGLVHAYRTPRTEAFAPVEAGPAREKINA
ncbi:hypothetical protein [Catellatospora tritici]|uniref:hypothetical protein n=1 Tax=Catellatospora tritici TaxID=2851566 RepID=UPI001C2DAF55|nr:hypothetical protein [Catellatospora tritici]MBV1850474.1 hypothetical protein [Catellatospora tritici]